MNSWKPRYLIWFDAPKSWDFPDVTPFWRRPAGSLGPWPMAHLLAILLCAVTEVLVRHLRGRWKHWELLRKKQDVVWHGKLVAFETLVGGKLTILKNDGLRQWVSDDPIYEMENKQCLKPLTRISPTYNMKNPDIWNNKAIYIYIYNVHLWFINRPPPPSLTLNRLKATIKLVCM